MPQRSCISDTRNTNVTGTTAFPKLAGELRSLERIGVLVSGGCDSEVLLRVAADVLGSANTIAFTAVTPFIAAYYTEIVKATTKELNVKLIQVELNPLQINDITANTSQRCYHCKNAIYSAITAAARKWNITILADGTNLDDTAEHRPGLKAAEELNISHPFLNAGMTKADIRELGKQLGMENPDRPSDSCLATRIPEQTPITAETLSLVSKIEQPLRPHVKGRLRARVSKKHVILEYQTIDRELVKAHQQELQTIADDDRHSVLFNEISYHNTRELFTTLAAPIQSN
ncbi:MAG: ATP-dependent sacrificial sulfur transferase LarE [Candidatus Sabulitectum sp.]|nr:ATP-dependent sacrificial sulfur transferase LarE [Candidatus Sabulitectum sp.]